MISVRVVPRASRNRIQGVHGEHLKISLRAPPVDGKANEELIKFLSKHFKLHPRQFFLVNGHTARNKRLHLQGIAEAAIRSCVSTLPEKTHA